MLIIGIDPGISGAICFFENGEIKDVIDMPNMAEGKKNKKQINGPQLFNELDLFFRLKEIKYNTYKGSRNLKNRNKDVTEYLWILSPLYDIIEPYDITPLV